LVHQARVWIVWEYRIDFTHHEVHEEPEIITLNLRALRTTIVQNLRSMRKLLGNSDSDIHLAKTPRAPSSDKIVS
jgi:hypothetical protein